MGSLRRIDSHFHYIPKFWVDAALEAGILPTSGKFPEWSPERGVELMDANDVATAIASLSIPGIQFLSPEKAKNIARRCNEYSAEICDRWKGRYGGLATVPMQDTKIAFDEIVYALDVLKLDGVCLFTSYGDNYLGDAVFDPILAELNNRRAVVFVHPALPVKPKLPYPGALLEYPTDTARMATHLMFSGALDRYPGIRFILSHAGGTLPYLAWRLYSCQMATPTIPHWSYEQVCAAMRRFWYDTAMSVGAATLNCLMSIVGPERVVFGSDWPYMNDKAYDIQGKGLAAPGLLTDAQAIAIARGNASSLFPRFADARATVSA